MAHVPMTAEKRDTTRKSAARAMRRSGNIPAVLYGGGKEPVNLVVNTREVEKVLSHESINVLIDISVKDGEKTLAMIKEVQAATISRKLEHLDLLRISMDKKVDIKVPVIILNAEPIKKRGGVVQVILNDIELKCLPTNIPEEIVIDLADCEIGTSLHISDMPVLEGVEYVGDPSDPVVSVLTPKVKVETAGEGAEGAEGAEGEGEEGEKED